MDIPIRILTNTRHSLVIKNNLKTFRACLVCKKRKKKCNGKLPCNLCSKLDLPCVYPQSSHNASGKHSSNKRSSKSSSTLQLPPKEITLRLISKTWDTTCLLFRFYHRPTVLSILDSLYTTPLEQRSELQTKTEILIHSIISVGILFINNTTIHTHEDDPLMKEVCKDNGLNHFNYAKEHLDLTNTCSSLIDIQTLFMLSMYYQSIAHLKNSYSFIGIALRSSILLRLNNESNRKTDLITLETEKRLFWTIYKVDLYLNCILELPLTLSLRNINQLFPIDVDDNLIHKDSIDLINQPPDKISSIGLNNYHTRLIIIMSQIHDSFYNTSTPSKNVSQLKESLQAWKTSLPNFLQLKFDDYPSEESRAYYLKSKYLLHLDFLLTNLLLHKPFIHFLNSSNLNEKLLAQNCIQFAKQIIQLSTEMFLKDLIDCNYWFTIHTIYFSVLCLKIQSRIESETTEINAEIAKGIDLLNSLKNSSSNTKKIINDLLKQFDLLVKKTIQKNSTTETTTTTTTTNADASTTTNTKLQGKPPILHSTPSGTALNNEIESKLPYLNTDIPLSTSNSINIPDDKFINALEDFNLQSFNDNQFMNLFLEEFNFPIVTMQDSTTITNSSIATTDEMLDDNDDDELNDHEIDENDNLDDQTFDLQCFENIQNKN
ncbi:hypothetical protein TBLA_0A05850 [Henningerozyma blattae CBS 6284]|uniref:Zn(2)-C6 fungal-type domain-containing protein n=1 Tax=Henningerozyma blattae (strain ATCC 34711 / CBS 6284 / DSM 70876 / NBRC 10599 / NRRL Y-10934 / UCD 77-7) TaxID=1071380 RepID=I2GW76_HENB6|nr:hypothetical protein TBLA_0A05850 [Tetrapisispora blattae CBS 6284]CCH58378.1 hypothetical protein TBLA_0A05850 [Tetrapisispora blattae CBS 6284]